MTINLASSTTYTNANASGFAWFTIEARDIYTSQPVPKVAINATVRLSRDDVFSDPKGKFPYNVSIVTSRNGWQRLRSAAVSLKKTKRGSGVQVILQIVKVQHPVYILGSKPMLRLSTPLLYR
jgi:hypothetical protein